MTLTYKNYTGEYHYNPSSDIFTGHIIGIEEQIYFYGDTEHEIETEFVKAVETYIKLNTSTMSYDEQRISDHIDGGLFKKQQSEIKKFVKEWMDSHEPDTFIKNEYGNYIYSYGSSFINLVCFFELILEEYINLKNDENENKTNN